MKKNLLTSAQKNGSKSKSIIYAMKKHLCTDIHWHLCPCLTVMWLATRLYKHEQICSMTARLCFKIYYETGSYKNASRFRLAFLLLYQVN